MVERIRIKANFALAFAPFLVIVGGGADRLGALIDGLGRLAELLFADLTELRVRLAELLLPGGRISDK